MATDTLTVAQLVERTRRHLSGVEAAPLNVLSAELTATAETASLQYPLDAIQAGVYFAVDDEIIYVWGISGQDVVVSRGMLGTSAAPHASGALVESPTRFPRPIIKDACQEEVRSWPAKVFQVRSHTYALVAGTSIVDLGLADDEVVEILSVTRGPRDATVSYADRWKPVHTELLRFATIDGVDSETALQVQEPYDDVDVTLNVVWGAPFVADTADDGDNVVTEWGVPRSMLDIIPLGAAARLILAREAVRTDSDVMLESRQAEQVPPQFLTQTATALMRIRDRRLGEEAMRLRARWPVRNS